MPLITNELFGLRDKVKIAIDRIKSFAPIAINNNPAGYHVCISGGKDSSVIQQLCIESGVKCEFVNAHTSVDYPETVYFIRQEKARVEEIGYTFRIEIPRYPDGRQKTMWNLIERWGLPTKYRWCCQELKEFSGRGRYIMTGVRWEESEQRKKRGIHETIAKKVENKVVLNNDNDMRRKLTEICMAKNTLVLNPIIDWTEQDVWEYLNDRKVPVNPLYANGHKRVGCVGCPMARKLRHQFSLMPKYRDAYYKAGCRFVEKRKTEGRLCGFVDGDELFRWWLSEKGSYQPGTLMPGIED